MSSASTAPSTQDLVSLYNDAKGHSVASAQQESSAKWLHAQMVQASEEGRSFHPSSVRNVRTIGGCTAEDGHITEAEDGEKLHD